MSTIHSRWRTSVRRALGSVALAASLLFGGPRGLPEGALMVYDFDLGPVPAANADYVRSIGFAGIVTRCKLMADIPKLADYAAYAAQHAPFRVMPYVNYDFNHPDSPQVWLDALPLLESLDAPLWVLVKNATVDAEVDALLLRMAQESQSRGIPMVLYPHWDTNIEDADEAAVRMARVGHPNISLSLNTCHEIRGGNQYSMGAVTSTHAAATEIVTIAGAEANAYAGPPGPANHNWDDAIMPLDDGQFDLLPFLRALDAAAYDGPIILQTYGLGQDPGHLERSFEVYSEHRRSL